MSSGDDAQNSIDTLAVEIRYMSAQVQELKTTVSDMNKVMTQLQIKSASHATMFGVLGGVITAIGSTVSNKLFGA